MSRTCASSHAVRTGKGASASLPVRTCVGCRERDAAAALARLRVDAEGRVVAARRAQGRGAWVHPDPHCLRLAARRRAFARAFRREVQVDVERLITQVGCTLKEGTGPKSPGL